MSTALVTGGSAGLGRALATSLAQLGWQVVVDGRDAARLHEAREVDDLDGRLDLLVNNASTLGPTPLKPVAELGAEELDDIWRTNVAAPLALTQALLPSLRAAGGVLINISSDAAVEHYETWGGYAASKAALDHLTVTLGVENPWLAAYAVDPGDMRTAMQQAAFPGEDIGDRPPPETVVPHLLALLGQRPPSGRYPAAAFAADQGVSA